MGQRGHFSKCFREFCEAFIAVQIDTGQVWQFGAEFFREAVEIVVSEIQLFKGCHFKNGFGELGQVVTAKVETADILPIGGGRGE